MEKWGKTKLAEETNPHINRAFRVVMVASKHWCGNKWDQFLFLSHFIPSLMPGTYLLWGTQKEGNQILKWACFMPENSCKADLHWPLYQLILSANHLNHIFSEMVDTMMLRSTDKHVSHEKQKGFWIGLERELNGWK